MPSASREVGRVLLGLEHGMPGVPAGDWPTGVFRMAAHLDGLSLTERRRFFEVLFPRMVPFLDLAWGMRARLPYQMHGSRRAFRAPHALEPSRLACGWWLQRLTSALAGYD